MTTASLPWPALAQIGFERGMRFETHDLDEARAVGSRVFSPHALTVLGRGQRLHARLQHRALGALQLIRVGWQAPVAIDPGTLDDYYLLCFPLQGRARARHGAGEIEIGPQRPAIAGAGQRFRFEAEAGFEPLSLRVERAAVDAAWLALSGRPAPRTIDFGGAVLHERALQALAPVLALIVQAARGDAPAAARPHLHARLHELLLATLLQHQPHSLGGDRVRMPRPRKAHLLHAQAWMLERLAEPLTLAEVARAAGVPVRTLQWAFQSNCGVGPMQWLRERRLHAVREVLAGRHGTPGSVTGTALAHGFTHLGEFSQAYRRAFGETPRQTLARHG